MLYLRSFEEVYQLNVNRISRCKYLRVQKIPSEYKRVEWCVLKADRIANQRLIWAFGDYEIQTYHCVYIPSRNYPVNTTEITEELNIGLEQFRWEHIPTWYLQP